MTRRREERPRIRAGRPGLHPVEAGNDGPEPYEPLDAERAFLDFLIALALDQLMNERAK